MGGQQFGCGLAPREFPCGQIDIADGFGGADAELMARRFGRQLTDETADDCHSVAAIRHAAAPLARGL